MNIALLGAGAIGTLWAYQLADAGHTVTLYTRDKSEHSRTICLGNKSTIELNCNSDAFLAECDLLLVCVKSWQVSAATTPILEKLNPDTVLLFMHNGMGTLDELKDAIAPFPVLAGTTSHGALLNDKTHVAHTGLGVTHIGAANHKGARCGFMSEVLSHALTPVHWQSDISTYQWQKLAINCAINPLTAIHQCNNGALSEPEFEKTIEAVCQEVAAVMNAVGIETDANALRQQVNQVVKATANNLSSMHQDIAHHRRSEIDYITGYLIKMAKAHQINTPQNQKLYSQIKQLEQEYA